MPMFESFIDLPHDQRNQWWLDPVVHYTVGTAIQVQTHEGPRTAYVTETSTDVNVITGEIGQAVTVQVGDVSIQFGQGRIRSWTEHAGGLDIPSLNLSVLDTPVGLRNVRVSDEVKSEFPKARKKKTIRRAEESNVLDKIL